MRMLAPIRYSEFLTIALIGNAEGGFPGTRYARRATESLRQTWRDRRTFTDNGELEKGLTKPGAASPVAAPDQRQRQASQREKHRQRQPQAVIAERRDRKQRHGKAGRGDRHTVPHLRAARRADKHAVQQIAPDPDHRQDGLPDQIAIGQLLQGRQ